MGKSRKKKSISNVAKEKEDLNSLGNNCKISVQNDQIKGETKQSGNEIKDEIKLSEEADSLHSALTKDYVDNDNQKCLQQTEEAKLSQELASPNHVAMSSDEKDTRNFPHGKKDSEGNNWKIEETSSEKIQEENNSKSNLIEIFDEVKDIKAFEIVNSTETEATDREKSNSSDVHDESTPNVPKPSVIHDLQATDQDPLKMYGMESVQCTRSEMLNIEIPKPNRLNSDNPDNKLAERDRNLDVIGNKAEANTIEKTLEQVNSITIQDSKTDIFVDSAKIEADVKMNDFTVGSQNVGEECSIFTKKTEHSELQEVEEGNGNTKKGNGNTKKSGKEGFEATTNELNTSKSVTSITESPQEINKPFISNEAIRSTEDPVVLNEEVFREKLIVADNVIQKLNSPETPNENSGQIDNSESVTINKIGQQDSVKESQVVENLPANESKITCSLELLKDSEESSTGEAAQPKNKFYEAITGFWKHTAFSKRRPETTVSSGQPRNLSSQLTQMSSFHSSKISLTSTESLGTLIPSSELIKSSETCSESTTKVALPHSETNIILENTVTDTISGCCPQKTLLDDRSSPNSLNTTFADSLDSGTISETLQVVTSDSLSTTNGTIKDSDDSFEKMGDSKKSKKGKTESTNLIVFGHKVCHFFFFFLLLFPKFSFLFVVSLLPSNLLPLRNPYIS